MAWSEEETLALLEAVEEQEDSKSADGVAGDVGGSGYDWGVVAKRVGTKTAAQCLVRFLQLPVQLATSGDLEPAAADPLTTPLADLSHPAMQQVQGSVATRRGARRRPPCSPWCCRAQVASLLAHTSAPVVQAATAAALAAHAASNKAPAPSTNTDGDVDMTGNGGGAAGQSQPPQVAAAAAVAATAVRAKVRDRVSRACPALPLPHRRATRPLLPVPAPSHHRSVLAAITLQALADREEGTIRALMGELVQLQSLRVTRKLAHFDEMAHALRVQQAQLDKERAALLVARVQFTQASSATSAPAPSDETAA